tara:strand:- start:72 stop:992 length:921 start_codon:yes stop_codon:yes gene_type:complete
MKDFKNKTLLVNGCSHTAGSEIEYAYQGSCYHKAWPKHLGDLMKVKEVVNIAHPGASNDTIFRTTQDWIIDNVILGGEKDFESVPEQGKNTESRKPKYLPEDIIVILFWSGVDRYEVYVPKDESKPDGLNQFYPHNSLVSLSPLFDTNLFENLTPEYKLNLNESIKAKVMLSDNLFSDYTMLQKIVSMNHWLKSFNIQKYHGNTINSLPGFDYIPKAYTYHPIRKTYKNLLRMYREDSKYHYAFLDHDRTFHNYMNKNPDINVLKHAANQHYEEKAHELWAKKVYDFWFNPILTEDKEEHYHSNQC